MILYKDTKSFVTGISDPAMVQRDGVAFTDADVYMVADDSELAEKIISNSPDFDFITDAEGKLLDIEATPHVFTEAELRAKYELLVVDKIREQYSQTDENKVLREALASGIYDEFDIYNAFVEQCKTEAHLEVYGN